MSENGTVSELMLNTELLMDALETVTLDVFTFLIASVCVILFPTATVPYDTDEGVEVREVLEEVCVPPDPEPLRLTDTRMVPLLAFKASVPVDVPDAVGLNPIAKKVVAPEPSENGVDSELMLNPDPLIEALETTAVEAVEFLIANVCVTLFPTGTVPNDTDDGVEASVAA